MEKNIEIDTNDEASEQHIPKNKSEEQINKHCNRLPRVYLYFIYFLTFSFVGWLLETAFSFYSLGHFTKRGFLFGPICPIYGFGALILIIFLSTYKKHNLKLFLYAAVIFSIFEYFVSFIMEALFSIKLWNYAEEFLNLNGRISIFYSFSWGIIAILFINFIYPFFKKKINLLLSQIPYKLQITFVYLFFAIFISDTVLSCIKYILLF